MKENRYLFYLLTLVVLFFILYLASLAASVGPKEKESYREILEQREATATTITREQSSGTKVPESAKEQPIKATPKEAEVDKEEPQVTVSQPVGSPEGYFENMLKGYLGDISRKLDENQRRTDVIIRYYRHPADLDIVDNLSDLKLYIHERPVNERLKDLPSNALFYGDNVNKQDIQLVAYILVSNGLELKTIRKSKYHDDWKSNSIEIGADPNVTDAPIYSLERIRGFEP